MTADIEAADPATVPPTTASVTEIYTHKWPHPDDLYAIWLLRTFGREKFPGIEHAKVCFWGDRTNMPLGLNWRELEELGVILISVGGGRFDEHSFGDTERKRDKCASDLVADFLGISDNRFLENMKRYVSANDLEGFREPGMDLASICLTMNKTYGDTRPEFLYTFSQLFFTARYKEYAQYVKAMDEFKQGAELREFRLGGINMRDRTYTLATVTTDNTEIAKYARSRDIGVIIQKKPATGNVVIFGNYEANLDMSDVVAQLRREEAKRSGAEIPKENLSREDSLLRWAWQKKTNVVMNGSFTATETPTGIPLETIANIVMMFVKRGFAQKSRQYIPA